MKCSLILFFFLIDGLFVFSQELSEENQKKMSDAVSLVDFGQLEDGVEMFREILVDVPDNYYVNYELAYAYYAMRNYKAAVKQLNKVRDNENVDGLYFQLLGNSFDMLGNAKKAIAVYQNGLRKFPNEGRLYLEWGTALYVSGDYEEAIARYEKGVEMDPMFPSNYYALTKLFCNSDEKVWGMLYGEIFLNVERNTERTEEISKLLYHTYWNGIKMDGDTVSVSFSKIGNSIYFDGKTVVAPFGGIYESILTTSIITSTDSVINVESLNGIRKAFLTQFYKDEKQPFDNALFQYQKKVADAGHIDAYNHWILFGGENNGWAEYYPEAWDAFIDWFAENPMTLDKDHKFYRNQYVFSIDMLND